MNKHPLFDAPTKTDYVIVGVQFRNQDTYFYKAPKDYGIEPGDRIVTANKGSFSIPTVVGVYPPGSENEKHATDWVVQKIDTGRYEGLKLEDAR